MQQAIILALTAATAIAITILSLLRGDTRIFSYAPRWLPPVGHFLFYALLAFLCALALQVTELGTPYRFIASVALATAFGAAMEFLQKFRAGRFSRIRDVLIDAAGAALGAALALV